MLAEIATGLSSLKTASDIVKGLNAANTQAAINDVKLGLQPLIFEAREALSAAQEAQFTALGRIRDLEQEVVSLKDWEGEKQRYHLYDADRGALTYTIKPGMENGEPPHWLCANCFSRGQKSFLQYRGQDRTPTGARDRSSTYGCDTCKGGIKVSYELSPSNPKTPREQA